jgi:hypothetical protein
MATYKYTPPDPRFAVNPETGQQDYLNAHPDFSWFQPDYNGGQYVTPQTIRDANPAPADLPQDTQQPNTQTPPPPANTPPPTAPKDSSSYTPVANVGYAPIQGYDYGKLSDPTHTGTGKYNPDVKWFSQGLSATGAAPGAAGLKSVADWINANGGTAVVTGDGISINGGRPVDVLTNYNNDTGAADAWWFGEGNMGEGSTGAGESGGGSGGGLSDSALMSLLGAGNYFGGPGSGGVYGDANLQQVGQDPLSLLLSGGLSQLVGDASSRMHSTPQQQAMAMENARLPYEQARKIQLRNAEDALASRGILGEPGQRSGALSGAVGRIETDLAPAYTSAINNALLGLDDQERNWANTLNGAIQTGTNRQSALSDIALRSLDQNRLFNQFLATYGLDRARTMAELANGQNDQLLRLLEIYVTQQGNVNAGFV